MWPKSHLHGERRGFGAGVDAEPIEDAREVRLDRPLGDVQLMRDFLVLCAAHDELQHLQFALS